MCKGVFLFLRKLNREAAILKMLMRAAGIEMGVEARGRGTAPRRNVGKEAISLLVAIGVALAGGTQPSLASGIVSGVSAARGGAGGGSRGPSEMAAAPGRTSLRLRGGSRATEPRQTEPKVEGNIQNFFAFEGLIGAGKSTLLAKLEERGVAVIPEPLKAWQDSGIFAAFYGDMKRWSYTFQTSAFVTRVKAVEDALADKPTTRDFVGERSWFAGYRPASPAGPCNTPEKGISRPAAAGRQCAIIERFHSVSGVGCARVRPAARDSCSLSSCLQTHMSLKDC